MKKVISFGAVLSLLPMLVFAADSSGIIGMLAVVMRILSVLIPILITLAVIYFIWGVIQYTLSTDEESKKNARGKIINGLIGLFVIIAFWGIIALVTDTFGVGPTQLDPSAIPCIPNATLGVTCPL